MLFFLEILKNGPFLLLLPFRSHAIIPALSHPIWQQKGGVSHGFIFIFGLSYGKSNQDRALKRDC